METRTTRRPVGQRHDLLLFAKEDTASFGNIFLIKKPLLRDACAARCAFFRFIHSHRKIQQNNLEN